MSKAIPAYDAAVDAPAHHHAVFDYDSGPPVDRGPSTRKPPANEDVARHFAAAKAD